MAPAPQKVIPASHRTQGRMTRVSKSNLHHQSQRNRVETSLSGLSRGSESDYDMHNMAAK